MPEDQLTQLLQRVRYLKRAIAIQKQDYPACRTGYDSIIQKLESMVREGEIDTYLGVDSVYYHLLEELEKGESNIDKSAAEIRDFIA